MTFEGLEVQTLVLPLSRWVFQWRDDEYWRELGPDQHKAELDGVFTPDVNQWGRWTGTVHRLAHGGWSLHPRSQMVQRACPGDIAARRARGWQRPGHRVDRPGLGARVGQRASICDRDRRRRTVARAVRPPPGVPERLNRATPGADERAVERLQLLRFDTPLLQRARAAWTLLVAVVGVVLFVTGALAENHVGAAGGVCSLAAHVQGCSTTVFEKDAGTGAMMAGFTLALIGTCFGVLRVVRLLSEGQRRRSTSN